MTAEAGLGWDCSVGLGIESVGRGRPRSYEWLRSVGDAVVVDDRVGRAVGWLRSSAVMYGRSTPQWTIMRSSISSLILISPISGKRRRGISFGKRSFLSSGLLMGMLRTAFWSRSYSRPGFARIINVSQVSKPLGVNPGISGRFSRSSWMRWCSTLISRNSRDIEDVRSSKMSKYFVRIWHVNEQVKPPTLPWIRVIRIMSITIELLQLVRGDDNSVSRGIVLNLLKLDHQNP